MMFDMIFGFIIITLVFAICIIDIFLYKIVLRRIATLERVVVLLGKVTDMLSEEYIRRYEEVMDDEQFYNN